jgi:hypothetical protein
MKSRPRAVMTGLDPAIAGSAGTLFHAPQEMVGSSPTMTD